MTNNPSCIEPGNSLSPNLLLLLLLFQVNQDESGLSLLVLNSNSSGIPFSAYIPHDRHQKVLFSNLGLTVFVKHLVDLVKQVPQSALRGKKNPKNQCLQLPLFP
jgi:hypothetical protein